MSSMYEMVIACITKPPNLRNTEEINNILPWFKMKFNKIDDLKSEILHEIIKNCSFTETKRDDILIRQGDKGDCCYILLSGKVSVYINTEAVPDNPEDATVLVTEDKFKTEGKSKNELDRSRYGNWVIFIEPGSLFGELALIYEDCIRNASIIVDEATHLLVINRDLFNRSIKDIKMQETNFIKKLVQNSILFSNWLSKYKKQVECSLMKLKFGYNVPLITQGKPTNGLLFIIKGQAKVVVNVNQHFTQYPWMNVPNTNHDMRLSDVYDLNGNIDFETKRPAQNAASKRLQYNKTDSRQAPKNVEVCIVNAGEVIGDIEQGLELSTYSSSVITLEPTEVYILDAKNFERLCNAKRNFKTLKLLKKQAFYKIKYRGNKGDSIPFYSKLNRLIEYEEFLQSKESENKYHKNVLKNDDKTDLKFTNHRGPLIDLYGPGSVFYRNRQLRKEKLLTEQKRQHTEMAIKGQRGNQGGGKILPTIFVPEKQENTEDDLIIEEILNANFQNKGDEMDPYKSLNANNTIDDWETGSAHLQNLESRLQNWFLSINSLTNDKKWNSAKTAEYYTLLKRFKPEEIGKRIIPGKKIFLRPKKQPNNPLDLSDDERNQNYNINPDLKAAPNLLKMICEESVERNGENQAQHDPYQTENDQKPRGRSKSDIQRALMSHQYTIEEYKQLKQLLKKKETELKVFQMAMSI